ncbi:MAG: XRE family transcriptional regulator, partial [Lachnospiraceae bacterium]|nr:XRE family transcriptional regulator [Lachnospiraceae bacterium]
IYQKSRGMQDYSGLSGLGRNVMDVTKVGAAIRYKRIREGYTQQELAEFLGISYQAVSKWERGLCVPDTMYLSKLAEILNIELMDLLDRNIKFLDEEWKGALDLSHAAWEQRLQGDRNKLLQIYPMILCYFMLAGIRDITICSNIREVSLIRDIYNDGHKYGLEIKYLISGNKKIELKESTMYIDDLVFLYGSNLTKYFWHGMDRKDGVSILTRKFTGVQQTGVAVDMQRLITKTKAGDQSILPVMFVPDGFSRVFASGISQLINKMNLYAEPLARGMVSCVITREEECINVLNCKNAVESMTGEKMYDLEEVSRARNLLLK